MTRFRPANLRATSLLAFALLHGTSPAWSNDPAPLSVPPSCGGDDVCDENGGAIAAYTFDTRATHAGVQAVGRLLRSGKVVETTPPLRPLQALAFKQRGGPMR